MIIKLKASYLYDAFSFTTIRNNTCNFFSRIGNNKCFLLLRYLKALMKTLKCIFKLFSKYTEARIVLLDRFTIFTTVFHRLLVFKNGAGFLSWPLFILYTFL